MGAVPADLPATHTAPVRATTSSCEQVATATLGRRDVHADVCLAVDVAHEADLALHTHTDLR